LDKKLREEASIEEEKESRMENKRKKEREVEL